MTEPVKPVLLISDLHLETSRPDITRAFFYFLTHIAPRARALYILGDLFNVWVGDDGADELGSEVAQALDQLANSGTGVFIMHGNRDFLLGESYAARCGALLINDPFALFYQGKRYLLMHGDSLCTRDTDYMEFRTMVRSPDWQENFLARSLEDRREYAAKARARSKSMSSNKAEDIMDVTQSEVERLMQKFAVTHLIHGHTHRPAIHDFTLGSSEARRFVLGDWDQQSWYLEITPDEVLLQHFPFTQVS